MTRCGVITGFIISCLVLSECVIFPPKVRLNDGRYMPLLAFGTWLGNSTKGRVQSNGSEVETAVQWAIDAGYRHIDTAYAYRIEDQVGRAIAKKMAEGLKRDELFITTKLWNTFHAKDRVVPALRESLKALNLDYVDLYLIHWPVGQNPDNTYDYTDYLDTWRGMIDAKNLGLTKSIGLSNFNQSQIERILSHQLEKPSVLQVEVNLNLQQRPLREFCKSHDIVVTGYSPFGALFKTRRPHDAPAPDSEDPALVAMAKKYGKSVPQLVLRYLVELGVAPLPKSLTKSRIEENIKIFDFQLKEEDKKVLQNFDRNWRLIPQTKWKDYPFYPFGEKVEVSVV